MRPRDPLLVEGGGLEQVKSRPRNFSWSQRNNLLVERHEEMSLGHQEKFHQEISLGHQENSFGNQENIDQEILLVHDVVILVQIVAA